MSDSLDEKTVNSLYCMTLNSYLRWDKVRTFRDVSGIPDSIPLYIMLHELIPPHFHPVSEVIVRSFDIEHFF
jgi:hypothetical protein